MDLLNCQNSWNHTCIEAKNCTILSPWTCWNLFKILNIWGRDLAWKLKSDVFFSITFKARPGTCSLAIKDAYNSPTFVQVPNLEKAVIWNHKSDKKIVNQQMCQNLMHYKFRMYLFLSITGSINKQSRDGLPGYLALSTDPSGSTSFFSTLKSCWPGLSLFVIVPCCGQLLLKHYSKWIIEITSLIQLWTSMWNQILDIDQNEKWFNCCKLNSITHTIQVIWSVSVL